MKCSSHYQLGVAVIAQNYSAYPGDESFGLISSASGHCGPCINKILCFVCLFPFRLFYLGKSLCIVERQIRHSQTFNFAEHAGSLVFREKMWSLSQLINSNI